MWQQRRTRFWQVLTNCTWSHIFPFCCFWMRFVAIWPSFGVLAGDHLEKYIEVWSIYDPKATQYILSAKLEMLLLKLPPPLGLEPEHRSRADLLRLATRLDIPEHNGRFHFQQVCDDCCLVQIPLFRCSPPFWFRCWRLWLPMYAKWPFLQIVMYKQWLTGVGNCHCSTSPMSILCFRWCNCMSLNRTIAFPSLATHPPAEFSAREIFAATYVQSTWRGHLERHRAHLKLEAKQKAEQVWKWW